MLSVLLYMWHAGNTPANTSFIYPAVHAVQPANTALGKSAWTNPKATTSKAPLRWALDGNAATFTRIKTSSAFPFMGVDLTNNVTLLTVVLRLWNGECLGAGFICIMKNIWQVAWSMVKMYMILNSHLPVYFYYRLMYVFLTTEITMKLILMQRCYIHKHVNAYTVTI